MAIIFISNRKEKEHTMRNNVMTGPIILSGGDHGQFRQDVLNPTFEYLLYQRQYFEKLDSSMVIHKEGTNTRVDFKDLDLSNHDKDYTMKMK